MAFDAFCYSTSNMPEMNGETQDVDYSAKKAFEVLTFELGAENVINIGSITGGGGAGKATFKEFTVTKKTDASSPGLFNSLVTGFHYANVCVDLRRSGVAVKTMRSGGVFMKFDMRLVMVQDISWSGSDGDDVCEETVIFQFGAIEITYVPQDAKGGEKAKVLSRWSRVKNNNSLDV